MEQIHWCIVPLAVAIFLWFAPKTMLVSCPKEVQLLKAVNAKSWGLNKPAVCWPRIYWLRPGNLRHKQSLGRSFILISKFSWPEGKCMECQRTIRHCWIEEAHCPHAASTVSCRIRRRKHWKSTLPRRFYQSCFWRHSHPFVSYRLNRYSTGFDLLRAHWCEVGTRDRQ